MTESEIENRAKDKAEKTAAAAMAAKIGLLSYMGKPRSSPVVKTGDDDYNDEFVGIDDGATAARATAGDAPSYYSSARNPDVTLENEAASRADSQVAVATTDEDYTSNAEGEDDGYVGDDDDVSGGSVRLNGYEEFGDTEVHGVPTTAAAAAVVAATSQVVLNEATPISASSNVAAHSAHDDILAPSSVLLAARDLRDRINVGPSDDNCLMISQFHIRQRRENEQKKLTAKQKKAGRLKVDLFKNWVVVCDVCASFHSIDASTYSNLPLRTFETQHLQSAGHRTKGREIVAALKLLPKMAACDVAAWGMQIEAKGGGAAAAAGGAARCLAEHRWSRRRGGRHNEW